MTLYLINHGDISYFENEKLTGRTDIPLKEAGVQALETLAQSGYYPFCDIVYSAPLKRCLETAALAYPHAEIKQLQELNEYNYGEFEGVSHDLLRKNEKYLKWVSSCGVISHSDLDNSIGSLENNESFLKRIRKGVFLACEDLSRQSLTSGAIVTTPYVIMNVIATLYEGAEVDSNAEKTSDISWGKSGEIDKYQFALGAGRGLLVKLSDEFDKILTVEKL